MFSESESRKIVDRIRQCESANTTEVMPQPRTIPAARYVDGDWHRREWSRVLKRRPIAVCPIAAVAGKGDYFTTDLLGTPILCVNAGADGIHVFVNRCSHRGSPLARAGGKGAARLVCPFHAWSYDLNGCLAHCPHPAGAELGIDQATLGLRRLPSSTRAGTVWTVLLPNDDGDSLTELQQFAPELEAIALDQHRLFHHETRQFDFNWKMGVDAALETYHFTAVHTGIARAFLQTLAIFDSVGDNSRMIFPKKRILEIQQLSEVASSIHINYFFFPASFLLKLPDHSVLFRYLPIDAQRTQLDWFVLVPPDDTHDEIFWRSNADLFARVALEDAAISEATQRGLGGDIAAQFTLTNIEPGVAAFHSGLEQAIERATDLEPL